MPNTPNFDWEYPAEEQDPWYSVRETFDKSIEKAIYSLHENRNTIFAGGGTIAFAVPPTFTWSADIELLNLVTGKITTIVAGSISVNDGEVLYVDVTRPLLANATATIQKATTIGKDLNRQLIGVRRGSKIYLINGSSY
jgi:hypothetical protein